jgi:hypothetical protein
MAEAFVETFKRRYLHISGAKVVMDVAFDGERSLTGGVEGCPNPDIRKIVG